MSWLGAILNALAAGIEWLRNNQLLKAGRAMERNEEDDKSKKGLAARDAVSDVDRMLKPPSER